MDDCNSRLVSLWRPCLLAWKIWYSDTTICLNLAILRSCLLRTIPKFWRTAAEDYNNRHIFRFLTLVYENHFTSELLLFEQRFMKTTALSIITSQREILCLYIFYVVPYNKYLSSMRFVFSIANKIIIWRQELYMFLANHRARSKTKKYWPKFAKSQKFWVSCGMLEASHDILGFLW